MGGVFIYDPVLDSFTAFDEASDNGSIIRDFVTMIGSDEDGQYLDIGRKPGVVLL